MQFNNMVSKKKNRLWVAPPPFSIRCVANIAHLAQPCAQALAISASPCYGRACAHHRFYYSSFDQWESRKAEKVQRKTHECDSSKDTLVSHGIPLRTKLARFFPNTNPLFPSFFFFTPLCCPHPRLPCNFPQSQTLNWAIGIPHVWADL